MDAKNNSVSGLGREPGELLYGARVEAPQFSICIPTFARPDLLREAIASAVGQDFRGSWEVVVCDNGREEATLDVVAKFDPARVCLWRNSSNLGMIGNWNQCIALAVAPWMTILHDDDLLAPGFLSACQRYLDSDPQPAALFGESIKGEVPPAIWPDGSACRFEPMDRNAFLTNNPISFPGVCFARELGTAPGGFRPDLGMSADYDFWARLANRGRIARSGVPLSFYRISGQQVSAEAIPRIARDFRRVQRSCLINTGVGPLRTALLCWSSGVLIEAYYKNTYGSARSLASRSKARLAGLVKMAASRGLGEQR